MDMLGISIPLGWTTKAGVDSSMPDTCCDHSDWIAITIVIELTHERRLRGTSIDWDLTCNAIHPSRNLQAFLSPRFSGRLAPLTFQPWVAAALL